MCVCTAAASRAPWLHRRLWGYEDGSSCAFKDDMGEPVHYDGYVKTTWEEAPVCPGQPDAFATADSRGALLQLPS